MSALADFIREMVGSLDAAKVDYMITGSLASTYYSEPRSTIDVDMVVTAAGADLVRFANSLDRDRLYLPSDESILTDSQFNVIDLASGWKLDVMIRRDRRYSVEEFSRRRPVKLLGVDTFIASPEDVILSKLEWASMSQSERQLGDARSVIQVQDHALDIAYLRQWADELSVSESLEKLLTS